MRGPIKRMKVSEQIVEEIKRLIREGVYPPESKLPSEAELAKMFGVSRSPVREALSVLVASGLIESRQGGGSVVKSTQITDLIEQVALEMIDIQQVLHLLEMRTILETEAAALAAERRKEQHLLQLKRALDDFGKMIKDDNDIGLEADFAFHLAVVEASHNPVLLQVLNNISDLYRKSLKFTLKQNRGLQRKKEKVVNEHRLIYEAIKNQDSESARKYMREHLLNVRKKLEALENQSINGEGREKH